MVREGHRAGVPHPTVGTGGGGASCAHFWSEAFRNIAKDPHLRGTFLKAQAALKAVTLVPTLHPVEELTPITHRNPGGTNPLGLVSPWQDFTSSLPGPEQSLESYPSGTASPRGGRERNVASELGIWNLQSLIPLSECLCMDTRDGKIRSQVPLKPA